MDSLLLWTLTISLMFAGGHCASMSQSCSTVNGKTVCETQRSSGNYAGAASNARTGPGGDSQSAAAMTGNSYTGQSSASRTQSGNMPPGGFGFGSFPFSFGPDPTFNSGLGNPTSPSASNFVNTGTGNTFVTSTSGSDGAGADGAFAGSTAGAFGGFPGGFGGATAGGFGGSGVFVGGGAIPGIPGFGTGVGGFVGNIPFPFGVAPSYGGGTGNPTGPSASNFPNTGASNTFVTSTSGSDGTGAGGAFAGSTAGGFGGFPSGFGGATAGGFGGSGVFVGGGPFPGFPFTGSGGGVYVGPMSPQDIFGPGGSPFSFVFGRR